MNKKDFNSLLRENKKSIETVRALTGSARIKIILALSHENMTVTELAKALGFTVTRTSHQLRILRKAKAVSGTREGNAIRYSIRDKFVITHVGNLNVNL